MSRELVLCTVKFPDRVIHLWNDPRGPVTIAFDSSMVTESSSLYMEVPLDVHSEVYHDLSERGLIIKEEPCSEAQLIAYYERERERLKVYHSQQDLH